MDNNIISAAVITAAINVHKELGPGLFETVYQRCLVHELSKLGFEARTEVPIPIVYDGIRISEEGFRIDVLVQERVIVELKSVEKVLPVHKKQVLTYLKLADKPLGLLINFNEPVLMNGITRIANGS